MVMVGFATLSVSTGEAKPRGTFIAENALQGATFSTTFSAAAAAPARAAQVAWESGKEEGSAAHAFMRHCTAAGLEAYLQHFGGDSQKRGTNVVCISRARHSAAGGEAIVLGAPLPRPPPATAPPLDAPWLALALGGSIHDAGWRGTDVVLAFLDADDVDGGAAAVLAAAQGGDCAGGCTPLLTQMGRVRAALFLSPWSVSDEPPGVLLDGTSAAGGQAELDFLRSVTDAMPVPVRTWHPADSHLVAAIHATASAVTRAVNAVAPPPRWRAMWAAVGRVAADAGLRTEPTVVPAAFVAHRAATLLVSMLQQTAPALVHSRAMPHAPALAAGIDAVTLHPYGTHTGRGDAAAYAVAVGAALERSVRSLTGLDERLHANARTYLLLSPTLFVGLDETAIPCAVAHLPVLFLTVPTAATPSYEALALEVLLLLAAPAVAASLARCLDLTSPAGVALLAIAVAAGLRGAATAAFRRRRPASVLWQGDAGAPLSAPLYVAWLFAGITAFGALYLAPAAGLLRGAALLPWMLALTAYSRAPAAKPRRAVAICAVCGLGAWALFAAATSLPAAAYAPLHPPHWVASSTTALLLHLGVAGAFGAL